MATAIDFGTLITQSSEVCGGRPRIAGTGVAVMRVAGWHKLGFNPEEIVRKTGLTLAQIHAALAYYHANQEAIDSDLDHEASEHDRLAWLARLASEKRPPQRRSTMQRMWSVKPSKCADT